MKLLALLLFALVLYFVTGRDARKPARPAPEYPLVVTNGKTK